ncbi:MAG: HD domain-containing protein [Syntrophales bacterium]
MKSLQESSSPIMLPESVIQSKPYQAAVSIVHHLRKAGHQAYFVGGCVRDLIMGIEPGDFDIATAAVPEIIESLFSRTIPVGARFGVMIVVEGVYQFEVATFRSEDVYEDGRRPLHVTFSTAKEDVRRRDFTINGLLMDPETDQVIDYVDGQADIRSRIIRTIGNPDDRFSEDHLRMLRAVRFAANLDFDIETATFEAIQRNARKIDRISAERIREEMSRLLSGDHPRRGLELLDASSLLYKILPEVAALRGVEQPPVFHPEGDVLEHTLRMLELLPAENSFTGRDRLCLAWAALLHDVGKAVTRSENESGVHFYAHVGEGAQMAEDILRRLNFSNEDRNTIIALIGAHMRFMHVRQMRPSKLKRFIRQPDFPLHLELHRLDCLGSHGMLDYYEFCKQKLEELPEKELRPPRLISGYDLKEMGYEPGPVFREILGAVEDAQLNGEISSVDAARTFISKKWLLNKIATAACAPPRDDKRGNGP